MTRSEIEAIASAVAHRLQPRTDYRSDRGEIDAIASALARRISSPGASLSREHANASPTAYRQGFASRISARMASGIAARLASAVTKRLDEQLGKHIASSVAKRLGDEQLGRVASKVASKIASGRARATAKVADLPPEDLTLDTAAASAQSAKP